MNEHFEQRAASAIGLTAAGIMHRLREYPTPVFYLGAFVVLGVLLVGTLALSPLLVAIIFTRALVEGIQKARKAARRAQDELCLCGHPAGSHIFQGNGDNCAECGCRAFTEP